MVLLLLIFAVIPFGNAAQLKTGDYAVYAMGNTPCSGMYLGYGAAGDANPVLTPSNTVPAPAVWRVGTPNKEAREFTLTAVGSSQKLAYDAKSCTDKAISLAKTGSLWKLENGQIIAASRKCSSSTAPIALAPSSLKACGALTLASKSSQESTLTYWFFRSLPSRPTELYDVKYNLEEPESFSFAFNEGLIAAGSLTTLKQVTVWEETASSWNRTVIKLPAGNPSGGFGATVSVAVSADHLVVGARYYKNSKGAAFVYNRSNLNAPPVDLTPAGVTGEFGTTLAISGNAIAVTDFGAYKVYIFKLSSSGAWDPAGVVTPGTDAPPTALSNNELYNELGWGFSGSTLAVSVAGVTKGTGASEIVIANGKILIYEESNGKWPLKTTLQAPKGTKLSDEAPMVAISGDNLVAAYDNDDFNTIVLYRKATGGVWKQTQIIKVTDWVNEIALNGDSLATIGPYHGNNCRPESIVGVYVRSSGSGKWTKTPIKDKYSCDKGLVATLGGNIAVYGRRFVLGIDYFEDMSDEEDGDKPSSAPFTGLVYNF